MLHTSMGKIRHTLLRQTINCVTHMCNIMTKHVGPKCVCFSYENIVLPNFGLVLHLSKCFEKNTFWGKSIFY